MTATAIPALRLRVLIVEDEALIAEEIRERLTRLDYQVVAVADTGALAIAAVEDWHPDIVLMDIRLKGPMDGIEAAEMIGRATDVPIVYLTAHSDRATLQRAKSTAPLGYLLKPLQERDLIVTLEMAIHRHNLERRLRQSELRYATTLASIGDGVIATDPEERVTFMNPVASSLTGWSQGTATGMPIEVIMPLLDEPTWAPIENPIRQALRTGRVVRHELPCLLVARDGARIPLDNSAAPILDAKGVSLGAVVAFRDIRDRRLAEDGLRKAEAQLRQAQKMEAIGRLAGGVAHDFNNLLTVIMGSSQLLLGSPELDADLVDLVTEIQGAGQRSASLTRQLLTFSRRQVVEPRVLDLNRLVSDLEPILRRVVGEDLVISSLLHPVAVLVEADPGQLEQVILNIVINARDAIHTVGRITIETSVVTFDEPTPSTRPEMLAGRYVMLAITDTGTGMDMETRSHLFEPFFTTKEQGKGTGLGLATVYGIVRQSEGHIFVYSEVGHGSTFKIYLPAVNDRRDDVEVIESTPPSRGTETILLVEDEDAVRNIATQALKGYGYTVLGARSGSDALHLLAEHAGTVHLLASDVVMPGMGGRDLAREATVRRPGIRVLFLSGYTDDTVLRHGVSSGDASFLQKPFTPTSLARKVREALDR